MKGVEHEVTAEALSASGAAVVTAQGRALHVEGLLPGERARVSVAKGEATLLARLDGSPERVTPACEVFDRCGGCAWQHASPALQRDARLALLRRALPPALREIPVAWHPSPERWAWRTRARLEWRSARGRCVLGYRARRSHDLVDTRRCPVLDARLEAALAPLAARLATVPSRGEVSVALGAHGAPVASLRVEPPQGPEVFALPAGLVADGFAGAALWPTGATEPVCAGDPRPVVSGADGLPLVLPIEGFAQAHESLNHALARRVLEAAAPAGRRVLELYAGAGNFTVLLAREAASVVAVESSARAVEAMRGNLAARGLAGVSARAERAEEAARVKADVVVLDPPRAGAAEVCEALAKGAARTVVYVSCVPATLGRDLATLAPRYTVRALDAFEMFPHTAHVEMVATLTRGG